jgi:transposase-like protein
MVELRWPDGVCCPVCGSKDVRFITTRRMWECKTKHPKRQFSAKIGTIFEDSALGLDKWFAAIWMIANAKNGVSSYEVHRSIGVTQKSAWFMLHRIRLAMKTGSFLKSDGGGGEFEADESFVGGLAKNMHKARRAKLTGRGGSDKSVVMSVIRRNSKAARSKVKAAHVPNVRGESLHPVIRDNVAPGSKLYTDAWVGYRGLDAEYEHQIVDHATAYVVGAIHTNSCENFFSLLKRTIKGTYVSVEPFHLGAYLDEQSFRFNEREHKDGERFRIVLASVSGKRLTYKELTGHDEAKATS